jgi:hypothetical protein
MSKISKLPVQGHSHNTHHLFQDAMILQTETIADDFTLVHIKNNQPVPMQLLAQQLLLHHGNRTFKGTLASIDVEQSSYTVLFYTGPAQTDNLSSINVVPGDAVQVAIERNRLYYQWQATHHFLFGDEKAIGVFNALIEIALDSGHEYFGVLECNSHSEPVLKKLNLLLDCVPSEPGQPARNAIEWMEDMHPNCWNAWKNAQFYLAGSRDLIISFSEYLAARQVMPLQIQMVEL